MIDRAHDYTGVELMITMTKVDFVLSQLSYVKSRASVLLSDIVLQDFLLSARPGNSLSLGQFLHVNVSKLGDPPSWSEAFRHLK